MKARSVVAVSILILAALPLFASSTACSSAGESTAEQSAAVETTGGGGVIDLGCPDAPQVCTADGPVAVAEVDLGGMADTGGIHTAGLGGAIHPMADAGASFTDRCVAALKGATSATLGAVRVCTYTIAVCAALAGNANGTAIQKFCDAAAKIVNCRGKAEDEGRKLQEEVCKSTCSTAVACGDAGVDSGARR